MPTELLDLRPAQIKPHPRNPRRDLGDLTELAASITAMGVLEPVLVVPTDVEGKYWLLAGHRRHAASKLAKAKTVPAIVREDLDTPAAQVEAMLVENLQRADLTAIEEGDAYQTLIEFPGYNAQRIATATGRTLATVRSRLKVAALPDAVRTKVHDGQITIGDAEALAKHAADPAALAKLTEAIGTGRYRWVLQEVEDAKTRARLVTAARKRLGVDGTKVVDVVPPRFTWGAPEAGVPYPISRRHLTKDQHLDCPHRVVVLVQSSGPGGRLTLDEVEACTDLDTHEQPTTPDDNPRAADDLAGGIDRHLTAARQQETPAQTAEREAHAAAKAQNEADCTTANQLRRTHLRDLITGRHDITPDMTAALMAYTARLLVSVELYPTTGDLLAWLGLDVPNTTTQEQDEDTCRAALATLHPAAALLAVMAAADEPSLDRPWRWAPDELRPDEVGSPYAWLQLVGGPLGYDWTDWEAMHLTAAAASVVRSVEDVEVAGDVL